MQDFECSAEADLQGSSQLRSSLRLGVDIRFLYIPQLEGKDVSSGTACWDKYTSYCNEIRTERGFINCLARETKSHCGCMKDARKKAKAMDKMGYCFGCKKCVPKDRMLVCSRCMAVDYCSVECQRDNWTMHEVYCNGLQKKEREQTASGR